MGAKPPRAQELQWFLSESAWEERQVQERRLRLMLQEPSTAPNEQGVLVIDAHGVSPRGHKTAHVGKQYLAKLPFRAVVADACSGEDRGFKRGLRDLKVGYVLALGPSHAWWHPQEEIGSFQEAAQESGWRSAERPGRWVKVTRADQRWL